MSEYETGLSVAEKTQTQKNLNLVSQFIQELLATPEQFAALPSRATLVLLPPDEPGDPQLSFANLRLAEQLAVQGAHPILWSVGQPPRTGSQILPKWPLRWIEQQLSIMFDRQQDVLLVAFERTDRPTLPVTLSPYVIAQVDPETHVVTSLSTPEFLETVAPKSLALFDLLLLSTTELIGISLEEVQAMRNRLVHGEQVPIRNSVSFYEIVRELTSLAA